MNEIKIFENPEFGSVRTVMIGDEPWMVGKDIAVALGYSNSRKALDDHVDTEDKQQGDGVTIRDSIGREQHPTVINESGLYALVLSSKLPSAKKFRRWVTSEVLPTIRKTGGYRLPQTYAEALRALADKAEEAERLEKENERKTALIESMQPKVSYYDLILQCNGLISTTEISKDYGMSAKKLNKKLCEFGIQYKQSGRYFLYAKYEGMDYARSKTHSITRRNGKPDTKTHMYWTQKGRLFLYDFLKSRGVLPMVEWNGGNFCE